MKKNHLAPSSWEEIADAQAWMDYRGDMKRHPVGPVHYRHCDDNGTVELGRKDIADAQYAADEAAGGLVAQACPSYTRPQAIQDYLDALDAKRATRA